MRVVTVCGCFRIVQHTGVYPDYVTEASQLAAGRPNVQNRTLLLGDWTGSGIIHSKVWIADQRHFYVGSANNDWKSLTQVAEKPGGFASADLQAVGFN